MTLPSSGLEAFYVCAQVSSFTKAAERLHLTQSALSQRIKNLEFELQTTLFLRLPSGVTLTETGHELLRYCQTKSTLEENVIHRIQGEKTSALRGEIRIGGFSSINRSVVLPVLSPLISAHPNLRLKLMTRELHELPRLIKQGEIDFMILDRKLESSEIESAHLGNERNVLIQRRGYNGPEVYLDHDEMDDTTAQFLKKARGNIPAFRRRFLDDIYGIIDGVEMGMGRAVVPSHLISKLKWVEVVSKSDLKTPVVLHYYALPFYPPLLESVIARLKTECQSFLDK